MASKQAPPRRNEVIRCENCGEDYSVTYKRCPFCDERPGRGSRPAPSGSGRRVAGGRRRGGVNPLQVAGLVISLILIIAAMVIVFRAVSPLLGPRKPSSSDSSSSTSSSSSASSSSGTSSPGSSSGVSKEFPIQIPPLPDLSGVTTNPGGNTTTPSGEIGPGSVVQVVNASGGLNIRSGPGTGNSVVASVRNGDKLTVVEDAGSNFYKVTFSGEGGQQRTGYVSKDYVAYVSGPTGTGTNSGSSSGTNSGSNSGSGTTTPSTNQPTTSSSYRQGAELTVINAGSGLNVRSGPGTSYSAIATVLNGNTLTFQSDAGDGWIQITFRASGGSITTGYVRSDYVRAAG